ncbi:MAG: GAF domain-containing protein [Chloroflexaceae bacterium]|nr:GAF domain-containing protein [Chloroflexaceae bacterium]
MSELAHILVIDDDAVIRRLFDFMLSGSGYRVSQASSGEEALAFLQLVTPDLILVDLLMPGMHGHEVIRRIKADTSKPFIPVIVVSAQADLDSSVSSLDAGADDVITKPVVLANLLARVRAMLRLQRAQRSLEKERRKTELLLHLTRELGASIDLDVLLTRFLSHLADAVGAVRASIVLTGYDEEREIFYSSSRNAASPLLPSILSTGAAGWVLRTRQPLLIADTQNDERWLAQTTYQSSVRSVAAMPILREGTSPGVITLVHHRPNYFTQEHMELLDSVAAQTAVALESVRLFRLTQRNKELLSRRAEELRLINVINSHLSELMYPEQLVRLAAYMIQQQLNYHQVYIWLREGDELQLQGAAGADAGPGETRRLPQNGGLHGLVVCQQQPLCIADTRTDVRWNTVGPLDGSTRSLLLVPIMLRGQVYGLLDLRSPEAGAFGANDEAMMSAVVSQLGVALGNALLLDDEQRRVRQLSQVNQLSVAVTAGLDATNVFQIVAETVADIFGVRQAGLALLATRSDTASAVFATSGSPHPEDTDVLTALAQSGITERIENLHEPQLMTNLPADPNIGPLARFCAARGIDSVLAVPLIAGGVTQGVLWMDTTLRERQFGRAELELATTVASLLMQVIENAHLYRAVEGERSTLNAVLRGAADPIMLIGPNDELLLANRAASEKLALCTDTMVGKPLPDLAQTNGNGNHAGVLSALVPLLSQANGTSSNGSSELNLLPNTTYSVSVAPVQSADGQPLGRVAVLQDISPIKELERQERERERRLFRRYVSPSVAEQLLNAGQELGQPTECDIVVVFADLRGFTSLTERIGPKVLIERVLNRYFTSMTEVLYRYEGTVDKYLGDGIIGVFGTPLARPDDPQRALCAAVDMQRAFAALRDDWRQELNLDIGMGIGLSYGHAVVGNVGSEQRFDYTHIGDVVNTANRLAGVAQGGQIIASYHLYDALPHEERTTWRFHELGPKPLKGKLEPHLIYEVQYQREVGERCDA